MSEKDPDGAAESEGIEPLVDEPELPAQPAESPSAGGGLELKEALETPEAGPAEAYLRRARLAEDRLQEVLVAYRKLRTDNEGHRDRAARNIERRFDQRRERLLLKFIDILDNLDRALEAAEATYAGEPLIDGLILVRTQLLQTLQEEGLERVPVVGLAYDPNVSEAVETVTVEDPDHDHVVVKELLRGYRLNGRLARASRVVVGQYPTPPPREEPTPATEPSDSMPSEAGQTLEDIVSKAEATEALFPTAFPEPPKKE